MEAKKSQAMGINRAKYTMRILSKVLKLPGGIKIISGAMVATLRYTETCVPSEYGMP